MLLILGVALVNEKKNVGLGPRCQIHSAFLPAFNLLGIPFWRDWGLSRLILAQGPLPSQSRFTLHGLEPSCISGFLRELKYKGCAREKEEIMSHHDHSLDGKKVAILVTDGFEQVEMTESRKFLQIGRASCRERV